MNLLSLLLLLPLAWLDEKSKWIILLIAVLYLTIHTGKSLRRSILFFLLLCSSFANWQSFSFLIKDSIAILFLLLLRDSSFFSQSKPLNIGHIRAIVFVNLIYVCISLLYNLEVEFTAFTSGLFSIYLFHRLKKRFYLIVFLTLFLVISRTQQLLFIASTLYLYRNSISQYLLGALIIPLAAVVLSFFSLNGRDYNIDIVELFVANRWAPFFIEYSDMTLMDKIFGRGLGSSFYVPWFEHGAYGHQNLYSPNIDSLFLTVYFKLGIIGLILLLQMHWRNRKEILLLFISGIGGSLIYQQMILVFILFKLITNTDEKRYFSGNR